MEDMDVHKKSLNIDEIKHRSLENANDLQSNDSLNSNENWDGKITPPKKKISKLYGFFSRLGSCTIA